MIGTGILVMELDLIEDQVFSFQGGRFGQNVLIFGVDMSSSAHINNYKKRHISSRKRTNTRIRTYINFRKNVLD